MQQSFFLIFTLRLMVFHIVIASLIHYPLIQAVLTIAMNIFMLLNLCITTPLKDRLKLGQHITQEAILSVVNTCVLIVA